MRKFIHKIKGFTLSEVLLVLSVIGVVAALTIPTLVQKVNNDQYVAKLKKTYSALQQAYNLMQVDNGGDITSVLTGMTNVNAANLFATKLNVIKNCGTSAGCWYNSNVFYLGGANTGLSGEGYATAGKLILADGTILNIWSDYTNCVSGTFTQPPLKNRCGGIYADLNGSAGPNTIGRDIFAFHLTLDGVYPLGSNNDAYNCMSSPSQASNSNGCAAKVLVEGAMNY